MAKDERQMRQNILVDMNDFILEYAARQLGNQPDLAEQVYAAGKDDLTGLDTLFKDGGEGRKKVYEAVAQGFISDEYPQMSREEIVTEATKMAHEAMAYLGKNLVAFDRWKNN